jgi:hypothetical protein
VNITSELEDNLFRVGIDISGEFYGDICKPEMGTWQLSENAWQNKGNFTVRSLSPSSHKPKGADSQLSRLLSVDDPEPKVTTTIEGWNLSGFVDHLEWMRPSDESNTSLLPFELGWEDDDTKIPWNDQRKRIWKEFMK